MQTKKETQKKVRKSRRETVENGSGSAHRKVLGEDRSEMLSKVWGPRKITRLNRIIDADFCGVLTVREFAAIVLADKLNFPRGLDTPICIGDFEGNFCTNVLSVTVGGSMSDHVCLMGDPHGTMS